MIDKILEMLSDYYENKGHDDDHNLFYDFGEDSEVESDVDDEYNEHEYEDDKEEEEEEEDKIKAQLSPMEDG